MRCTGHWCLNMAEAPSLHLAPAHRELLLALIARELPHFECLAFGSRTTGQSGPLSDLDLVIRRPDTPEIPAFSELARFRRALSESDLPFLVDVLDWAAIPAPFRQNISRHAIRIYPDTGA